MFSRSLILTALLSASASVVSAAEGACSYTTLYYNNALELQTSMGSLSQSYSVCSSTGAATTVAPTTTSAVAVPSSTCSVVAQAPCFYLTGHGFDKIEGKKLGGANGASEARFDGEASIWWIDSDQHLHIADSFNSVSMTYYIGADSWWGLRSADSPAKYGTDYQPSTCKLLGNGNLDCFQHGGINSNIINVWNYNFAVDHRAFYLAHWGAGKFSHPFSSSLLYPS